MENKGKRQIAGGQLKTTEQTNKGSQQAIDLAKATEVDIDLANTTGDNGI